MKFTLPARATLRDCPLTGRTVQAETIHGVKYTNKEHSESVIELEGIIELTVNVEELARLLGCRALCAKGGKAVEAGGLVSARVITKKEVSRVDTPARALTEKECYV